MLNLTLIPVLTLAQQIQTQNNSLINTSFQLLLHQADLSPLLQDKLIIIHLKNGNNFLKFYRNRKLNKNKRKWDKGYLKWKHIVSKLEISFGKIIICVHEQILQNCILLLWYLIIIYIVLIYDSSFFYWNYNFYLIDRTIIPYIWNFLHFISWFHKF